MNKKNVYVLLGISALIVWALTISRIPLAVSQPVVIPVAMIDEALPLDGANPLWESVPGVIVPLSGQTITTPMHPNISVKTVMIKMATDGKELAVWANWGDQTLNNTTIGPQDFRDQMAVQFRSKRQVHHHFNVWVSLVARSIFGDGMPNGRKMSGQASLACGMSTSNIPQSHGIFIMKSRLAGSRILIGSVVAQAPLTKAFGQEILCRILHSESVQSKT